ncbi:MAG: hypothetical protein HOY78_45565 [Saccharothrix sp.]|nr:hypothetical protein [Saccharothrix sp.]
MMVLSVVTPGVASAEANCGGAGTVVSANYVKNRTTGTEVGAIQLCRDGNGYYFAWLQLYYTMSTGQYANAFLRAWPDATTGTEYLQSPDRCDNGGSGKIIAPDRECNTAHVYYTDPSATYRADGYVYASSGAIIAAGATARTR